MNFVAKCSQQLGTGTLVNHYGEHGHSNAAHTMPIYQTSTFGLQDVNEAGVVLSGDNEGPFVYTRGGNPNTQHLAAKIVFLEGQDLINAHPFQKPEDIVAGEITSSGLSAISTVALTILSAGDTAIVQKATYGGSLSFWDVVAPKYGINVVFVESNDTRDWEEAVDPPAVGL